MRLNDNNTFIGINPPYQLSVIHSSKLIYPREIYQRGVERKRVELIARDFNEYIVNEPKVSFRNGRYYVMDGQHTIEGCILLNGGEDRPILCKVYTGLTMEQEALLFAEQNGHAAPLSAGIKLRAKVVGGDAPSKAFVAATNRVGLSLNYDSMQLSDYRIGCVGTALKLYDQLGEEIYCEALRHIVEAWEGKPDSFRAAVLRGVMYFVQLYHGQYSEERLVRALGGEIIEISPSSPHHINPLELGEGYDTDENPIAVKAEVITSILEQQMGAGTLTGSHKSIIDRCTANVYRPYLKSRGKQPAPLLTDWRNEVMRQVDPEAREIALAAELITEGSLNVFAHAGNVNMDSRIIALDLYEMGEQLRPTALVVTLEAIQNRVAANRKRGKFTWVFIDECYLYFKYKYSADVLYRAWKRWRKYGAPLTAATQNVEECLKSETARLMLANSEFLLLFNQAATDRAELGKLLRLSDTQMGYVTNVEAGHGLLRMGGALVPFVNTIPKDTELYRLMTTTPNEKF